ncbi:MAG: pilus assembly protein [Gammaproteobacteria bacterium]|nr:pilus assembly protein [Gammaproteobacteria bacterium]
MHKQNTGQSMVEFIIVTPVVLLLLFGALQFAFLYHAKTLLNYATFEAARTGAVSNARVSEMENAFARSMAAIHTHNPTSDDVMCAREVVYKEIESGFVHIDVINPDPDSNIFMELDDGSVSGDLVIPNNNLMYRSDVSTTGLTIQDANLLKIRVSYCYPLYVPYINRVLGIMLTNVESPSCPGCTGSFTSTGSFERACLENQRFPLHAQAVVRMQSSAMLSAVNSGLSPTMPNGATVTGEPIYQCGSITDHSVVNSVAPPVDITTKTKFWTLDTRVESE